LIGFGNRQTAIAIKVLSLMAGLPFFLRFTGTTWIALTSQRVHEVVMTKPNPAANGYTPNDTCKFWMIQEQAK